MNTPTSEQQAVIDNKNDARIRIVKAVPGSGKTWLVAELIRRELIKNCTGSQGIAALSFTRVGGEEIRRAVGYDLQHPHFIGTIDSFLFRFVVRPFLKQVLPDLAKPRLIPAEWEPKEWNKGPDKRIFTVPFERDGQTKIFNLFRVYLLNECNNKPVVSYKAHDWEPIVTLNEAESNLILESKKKLWKQLGWLTHSDAAYLANFILKHNQYGAIVRTEVHRRFQFLIVDELQDTGWFLGNCVMQLLTELTIKCVLVGDPDQAIFEFNGARPDLFDRFNSLEGAEEFNLNRTLRCSKAICSVANHLSESGRIIEPANDQTGRAFLLHYTNFSDEINDLCTKLTNRTNGMIGRVLARQTKTVDQITGLSVKDAPKLGSVPLNHLHRAVNHFRHGNQKKALAATSASLEYLVYNHEGIDQDDLDRKKIYSFDWKQLCVESLLEANRETNDETFGSWGIRISDFIEKRLKKVLSRKNDGEKVSKIRQPLAKKGSKKRNKYLVVTSSIHPAENRMPVQTVHAVKGETHDLTVLICPDPKEEARCPSMVWWSENEIDKEEKRIAFVAVTRTCGDLIMCVSEQCLARLKKYRADFVNTFDCMSFKEFIAQTNLGNDVMFNKVMKPE